jgi:putative DNA primase/helicase
MLEQNLVKEAEKESFNNPMFDELGLTGGWSKPTTRKGPDVGNGEAKKGKESMESLFTKEIVKESQYGIKRNILYRWSANHWKVMDDNHLQKRAAKFMGDKVNFAGVNSCAKVAMLALSEIPEQPKSRIIIPCKDSYLEIKGGKVKQLKPNKEFGFTYFINANMAGDDCKGGLFDTYLNTSVPELASQKVLQEFAGYSFLADNRYQKTIMLKGEGEEGKSIYLDALRAIHPNNGSIQLNSKCDFNSPELLDASLITCDEMPQGRINEQTLKALVSGDPTQFNIKYGNIFTFSNKAKLIFSGNHFPAIKDHSRGFWRRWIIVPFNIRMTEDKKIIGLSQKIIEHELDYILKWAVDGLLRLMANNGTFSASESIEQEMVTVRKQADSVLGWMDDYNFIESKNSYPTLKSSVYASYCDWTEKYGLRTIGNTAFWIRFRRSVGFEINQGQKRINGKPEWHVNFDIEDKWIKPVNDDVVRLPF